MPARRRKPEKEEEEFDEVAEEEEEVAEDDEEEDDEIEEDNDKSGNYREDGEEAEEEEEEEPVEKYQFISTQTSKHLEKIRKEQSTLLKQLKANQKKELAEVTDPQERTKLSFKHLLEQTEIYSTFTPSLSMHNIVDGQEKKGSASSSKLSGGSRRKHSEKEEDEEIIREALEDEEESEYQGMMLTSSPKFIENTTLRSYQLDGVNWLIRLHDRGVNGILAGMYCKCIICING